MKLALITAPNGFDLVDEFRLGYHLVLAQKCFEDPKYLEYYKNKVRQGHFIILDNGAAELQHSIDGAKLFKLADELGADEVCVPDALDDFEETMRLFKAYHYYLPPERTLGIPQGSNWEEWQECVGYMLSQGVGTIGIAKRYERLEGGRCHALEILSKTPGAAGVHVHLLGCYRDPLREVYLVNQIYSWVRGIDTAAPIAHAQVHVNMEMTQNVGHIPYTWNEAFHEGQARANIERMLLECTSF